MNRGEDAAAFTKRDKDRKGYCKTAKHQKGLSKEKVTRVGGRVTRSSPLKEIKILSVQRKGAVEMRPGKCQLVDPRERKTGGPTKDGDQ